MIIICGKTITEVEQNLEMAKMAIATGAPCGIGGATIEDVEQAMGMLKHMMGGTAPISNPNYVGVSPIEDQEEICPQCGEPYDGDYCEWCGYPDIKEEDEEEDELPSTDGPTTEELIEFAKSISLPPAMLELLKQALAEE